MIDNFPFLFRYFWPCSLDQVTLCYDPNLDFTIPEQYEPTVRKIWDEANDLRAKQGLPPMESNPLYLPGPCNFKNGHLQISAGITSYFNNYFLEKTEQGRSIRNFSGGGISVVPVCVEGEILIGKRSDQVASHAGRFHVCGGHAHPSPSFREKPDTFHFWVEEELLEEMIIDKSDIERLVFLGMAVDMTTSKPEWIIRAELKQESEFYINRWKKNQNDDSEFSELSTACRELVCSKDFPKNLMIERLTDLAHLFTPACQAALAAHFACGLV